MLVIEENQTAKRNLREFEFVLYCLDNVCTVNEAIYDTIGKSLATQKQLWNKVFTCEFWLLYKWICGLDLVLVCEIITRAVSCTVVLEEGSTLCLLLVSSCADITLAVCAFLLLVMVWFCSGDVINIYDSEYVLCIDKNVNSTLKKI